MLRAAVIAKQRQLEVVSNAKPRPEMPEPGRGDIEWLKRVALAAREVARERKENFLDFYVKYDDPPKTPVKGLSGNGEDGSFNGIEWEWVIVFSLVPDEADLDGDGDTDELRISDEAIEICQRFMAADLLIDPYLSSNEKELIVQVGAPFEILVDEANEMRPVMRLRNSLGSLGFQSEMLPHFTPNRFEADRDTTAGTDDGTPFTSALRQRLLWNRMERIAGVNLNERMYMMDKEDSLDLMADHIEDEDVIRGRMVTELLSAFGCYRPFAGEVFGNPLVDQIVAQVAQDPFFTVEPEEKMDKHEKALLEAHKVRKTPSWPRSWVNFSLL
jgi:hypothetical protein